MTTTLPDRITLSEDDRVAFLGAMLAMAAADGRVEATEVDHIFDLISSQQLSREAHRELQQYLVAPPELQVCLDRLRSTEETIRTGLMLALLQVAWADEVMDPAETSLLDSAQDSLRVSRTQRAAMEDFVARVRQVAHRGIDDGDSALALTEAVGALTDAAVPIRAVYLSGSILHLRAAGIASSLDSVGLGVGTVPGLDVAVLFSVELCLGVRRAFSEAVEERREQRAMDNLQSAINELIDRVVELEEAADESEEDLVAMRALTRRLRALQQALYTRRNANNQTNA